MSEPPIRPAWCLRWLAALLVRGPHAPFITHDLEELHARDRARGLSAWRAQIRYLRHLLASAFTVWTDGFTMPALPRVQWLDFKLASRMLVRHPGLTIVGGLALAIGIPVGMAPMHLANAINAPLPFEDGHRIVGIQYWDVPASDSREPRLHDFERWKQELTSFETLAAARTRSENVISDTGPVEVARGSEMTASAFAVTRVQPVLGRTLAEADELKGAPPVVVIGHDLWQTQFAGASGVLGRTLKFGRITRTVVGVMPSGFRFPYRDKFWVPLQEHAIDYEVGGGPTLWVFGRLRDGVSWEAAQAELTTVAHRIAADHPDTHERLRPEVMVYAHVVTGLRATADRMFPMVAVSLLMLAVACGNVGTLLLARTAGRSNEIAVRNALGAGRGRIVMQLFVEALVLAMLAAGAGLVLAEFTVSRLQSLQLFEANMPFWFDLGVTPAAVAIAFGLAVFSAVIAGLLPALKATGKRAYQTLQRQTGGGSGVRFGATATVLIVVEVAIAVGGLSGVASVARGAFKARPIGEGIAADEYLASRFRLTPIAASPGAADRQRVESARRLAVFQEEITRRLLSEPGVRAMTFAAVLPGMDHDTARIEVDAGASPSVSPTQVVRVASINPGFFEALGQRVLAGRDFDAHDLRAGERPVVVNRSFVEKALDGRNPVGQRIRFVAAPDQAAQPWRPIIGVVNDLGMHAVDPRKGAGIYQAVAPGEMSSPYLLVRVAGEPAAFVPRLRAIVTDVEPSIVMSNPVPLKEVFSEVVIQAQLTAIIFALVAVIGVVLSSAGLYALMAFSVAQRTREIAIRSALGAAPARIVSAVVKRAFLQLIAGVVIGTGLALLIVPEVLDDSIQAVNWRLMLAGVSTAMLMIGLLACVVPMRRALRIEPVQALKEVN